MDDITSEDLGKQIEKFFSGDVKYDEKTLDEYSHDTSLFRVKPKVVVFPKKVEDIKKLVKWVSDNKEKYPSLSVTGRSAGTDMTGGPLNNSIIVEFFKYFNHEEVYAEKLEAIVEPGVYYRNFEKETLPEHVSLPSYPASKSIAAVGGMVMNNSAGEKTLKYGQTRNFVKELHMVLSDGNEYVFGEITEEELEKKSKQKNFEGEVYRKMYKLIKDNYTTIMDAKPKVSKNSAGYALWYVYDKERKTFNLAQLFTGSQGTLGMLTKIKFRLVKDTPYRRLTAVFLKSWDELPKVVNDLLPLEPESLETFDDETLKLGLRFMPEIAKKAKSSFLPFAMQFAPEFLLGIKMLGMPKVIVLVQLAENSEAVLEEKTAKIEEMLTKKKINFRILYDNEEAEKYWVMRRESFNLLRQHVKGKRTAPFIEDFCVAPEDMPKFLPKVVRILKKYKIKANIAGHAGNGNFHIIPLMDMSKKSERDKIAIVADQIYKLIKEYGGSNSAEHNDGILRTPYLHLMFNEKTLALFKETKEILDPKNIFNPGKKVGGTVEFMNAHIAER